MMVDRQTELPFEVLETKVIEGRNLVQIGIRDFSNSKDYRSYVESHGVTVYTMKDVRERPVIELLLTAIEQMKQEVDQIYVFHLIWMSLIKK
ncbi:arginase family protein [Anaerobacillus sp. HL2]|nr:arginase family protein [Anaerobacillus sp. HL2]